MGAEWILPGAVLVMGLLWILSARGEATREEPAVKTSPSVDGFFGAPYAASDDPLVVVPSRRVICQSMSRTAAEWRGNAFAAETEEKWTKTNISQ